MSPLVGALLILLAVCALGVTAGLFGAAVRAFISRKSEELTDDRVKIRALAAEYANREPRLLDMSEKQRVDAQRKLITDKAGTHAVEFIATLTRDAVKSTTVASRRVAFADLLEARAKAFFPLGGHTVVLPYRESATGGYTLHVMVHMEASSVADAHEVAQQVCDDIMKFPVYQDTYLQLVFFPVEYSREAGDKPGLWTRRYTNDDSDRKYFSVARRGNASIDPPVTVTKGDWTTAREELLRITDEFVAFEFSPVDVAFTRRLLWDLTEPATARFYEAFDAANILLTDTEPDSSSAAQQFIEASRVAVAAWEAADRNARDKAEQNIVSGNQVLTEYRVKHRDTALAAMNLALDPSSGDYEVGTALAHSLKALDRAGLSLPPSKLKKLESNELVARAMRALPAGNG